MRFYFLLIPAVLIAACTAGQDPDDASKGGSSHGGAGGSGGDASSGGGAIGGADAFGGSTVVDPCSPEPNSGDLAWAMRAGGSGWDVGNGVASSPDGSISVTGNFDAAAALAPDQSDPTILYPHAGAVDMYVAHYDDSGNIAWAKRAGGPPIDFYDVTSGNAAASASDGGAIVAGEVEADATFGEGEPNEASVVSSGSMDAFVARYRPDGELGWVARAGGPGDDQAYGVASGPSGSVAMAGLFQQTATFGAGEAAETTFVSNGGDSDAFVAKYDDSGALLWARRVGGSSRDEATTVAIASDDSVIVGGTFAGAIVLGEGEPNETTLSSSPIFGGGFVARYAADGALVWAKKVGESEPFVVTNVVVTRSTTEPPASHPDSEGVVVAGYFMQTATFGEGEPNETTLTAQSEDIFIARYDEQGALQWVKQAGGNDIFATVRGLASTSDGALFVAGTFEEGAEMTFGDGEACATTVSKSGDSDLFLARYAQDGNLVWTRTAKTDTWDRIDNARLAVSSNGVFLTGVLQGTATFDAGGEHETVLVSAQHSADIFVARYDP